MKTTMTMKSAENAVRTLAIRIPCRNGVIRKKELPFRVVRVKWDPVCPLFYDHFRGSSNFTEYGEYRTFLIYFEDLEKSTEVERGFQ